MFFEILLPFKYLPFFNNHFSGKRAKTAGRKFGAFSLTVHYKRRSIFWEQEWKQNGKPLTSDNIFWDMRTDIEADLRPEIWDIR